MIKLSQLSEEYEVVKGLIEQNPIFVDKNHLYQSFLPKTMVAVFLISIFFVLAYNLMKEFQRKKKSFDDDNGTTTTTKFSYKAAYQCTNLMVNLVCSILGTFYFMTKVTKLNDDRLTIEERVLGYNNIDTLVCLQLGYNLWAIPVGYYLVDENVFMLMHHVAVICCTLTATFVKAGYNYYTPFMFGVLEISSIPLAVVNFLKDNKSILRSYPEFYERIRIVFAATFLYIRWYMFYPIMFDFLRLLGMGIHITIFILDNNNNTNIVLLQLVKILLSITWIGSAFVTFLQAQWGMIIIKGLRKAIMGRKRKVE